MTLLRALTYSSDKHAPPRFASDPSRILNRQTLSFDAAACAPTSSQNIPGLYSPLVTFAATKPMTTMRSQIMLIQTFTAVGHRFGLKQR